MSGVYWKTGRACRCSGASRGIGGIGATRGCRVSGEILEPLGH